MSRDEAKAKYQETQLKRNIERRDRNEISRDETKTKCQETNRKRNADTHTTFTRCQETKLKRNVKRQH